MASVSRISAAFAAAGLCGAIAGPAYAVPSYGDIAEPPGVYVGSGVPNGNWTIETVGNIELALRAKDRGTTQNIDGPNGVYHASPGLCSPPCSGVPKADWNYEFSVNVRADGNTTEVLSNYVVRLRIDTDPGAGTAFVLLNDAFTQWPDSEYFGAGGERTATSGDRGPDAGDYGMQQSANPLFTDSGFQPGFDPFRAGQYDIQLLIFDSTGTNLLASTDIQVAVPVPATALLMGLGLLGLGFFRRKTA